VGGWLEKKGLTLDHTKLYNMGYIKKGSNLRMSLPKNVLVYHFAWNMTIAPSGHNENICNILR
jgi:hypothetical protein